MNTHPATILQSENMASENKAQNVSDTDDKPARFSSRHSVWRTLTYGWLGLLVAGGVGLVLLSDAEMNSARQQWHVRLNVEAEASARAVRGWMQERAGVVSDLSVNPTVQLSLMGSVNTPAALSGMMDAESGAPPAALQPSMPTLPDDALAAQQAYLSGLLQNTALHYNLIIPPQASVHANIEQAQQGGIAVLRADGSLLVATGGLQVDARITPDMLTQKLALIPAAGGAPDASWSVAFISPVAPIQADSDAATIGYVVAVAPLDAHFIQTFAPISADTILSYFIWSDAEKTTYVSYNPAGAEVVQLADNANVIAEAGHKTGILAQGHGLDKRAPLLATGSLVDAAQNTAIVRAIDEKSALANARHTLWMYVIGYILFAGLGTVAGVALLRHLRAQHMQREAEYYHDMLSTISQQEALLDLIARNTPVATVIVDAKLTYRYANDKAAKDVGMEREAMQGKTLIAVLGSARAEPVAKACKQVLAANASCIQQVTMDEDIRIFQEEYIPLCADGAVSAHRQPDAVLILAHDITSTVHEQQKRAHILNQLVDTLVEMVDRRDPLAALHSRCVAWLAGHIGHQMQLTSAIIADAQNAGRLMNLGKMMVPESVLRASDVLSDEQRASLRASLLAAADLLAQVEFDGQVINILKESQEMLDGSGPLGLKGREIRVGARIISVTNSFVALVSSRSWRDPLSVDDALRHLAEHADTRYDRAVLAALTLCMDTPLRAQLQAMLNKRDA